MTTATKKKTPVKKGTTTKNAPTKAVVELTPAQKTALAEKKAKAEAVAAKKEAERVALLNLDKAVTPADVKKAKAAFTALNGGTATKKRSNWLLIGKVYASLQAACDNNSQLLKAWSKENGLDIIDNSSRGAAAWFYDNEEIIMQLEQEMAKRIKAAVTTGDKDQVKVLTKLDPATQNSPKHLRSKVGECLSNIDKETVDELGATDLLDLYTKNKATTDKVAADKAAAKAKADLEAATAPFDAIAAAGFAIETAEQVVRFTTIEQLENFSKELKAAITKRTAQLTK